MLPITTTNNTTKADSRKRLRSSVHIPTPCEIETTNRFALLYDEAHASVDYDTTEAEVSQPVKSSNNSVIRPPPIVVTSKIGNYLKFTSEIEKLCTAPPTFKYTFERINILTNSIDDFEKLKNSFINNKVNYFTYTLPNQKQKHLIMKGLPAIDPALIKSELIANKILIEAVAPLKTKDANPTHPIYLITLQPTASIHEVTKIRYICKTKIIWDHYKSKKPCAQCHRCQNFGHGSSSCNLPPRYVKCIGAHLTSECNSTSEVQCTNCKGNHPASYGGCPTLQDHLTKIQERRNKNGQSSQQYATYEPAPPYNGSNYPPTLHGANPKPVKITSSNHAMNWSHAVRQQQTKSNVNTINHPSSSQNINSNFSSNTNFTNNNNQDINQFQTLLTEIRTLNSLCNISNLIALVKNLNEKLKHSTDIMSQLQIFSQVINEQSPTNNV